jgi:hypothetical protein
VNEVTFKPVHLVPTPPAEQEESLASDISPHKDSANTSDPATKAQDEELAVSLDPELIPSRRPPQLFTALGNWDEEEDLVSSAAICPARSQEKIQRGEGKQFDSEMLIKILQEEEEEDLADASENPMVHFDSALLAEMLEEEEDGNETNLADTPIELHFQEEEYETRQLFNIGDMLLREQLHLILP